MKLEEFKNKITERMSSVKKFIIPISGGTDSAFLFRIMSDIDRSKVIGVYIDSGKELRCKEWFRAIGNVRVEKIDALPNKIEPLRWATFLNIALEENAWLVSSRTKTEDTLGTYSLASRVATYYPLINIWKSDLMLMCPGLVPFEIMESSRAADPDCGRPKEMAEISLEKIDQILQNNFENVTVKEQQYIEKIRKYNSFKAMLP